MRFPFSFLSLAANQLSPRGDSLSIEQPMFLPSIQTFPLSSPEEADGPRREGPAPPLQAGALQGRGRGRRHLQDQRG